MPRVSSGPAAHKRHRNIIKRAKGYYGRRKNTFRIANQAVEKAAQYAYRDRRVKKRMFRRLWVTRISAASRLYGTSYSQLIFGLSLAKIEIDRKMLSELAINDPKSFEAMVKMAMDAIKNAPEAKDKKSA